MVLWIRSQDKKKLRPNPKFGIEKYNNGCYIVDEFGFERSIILGKYETEVRALEVLDDINKIIIDNREMELYTNIGDMSYCQDKIYIPVYKMPKE